LDDDVFVFKQAQAGCFRYLAVKHLASLPVVVRVVTRGPTWTHTATKIWIL